MKCESLIEEEVKNDLFLKISLCLMIVQMLIADIEWKEFCAVCSS
jgi:hypothetical protein